MLMKYCFIFLVCCSHSLLLCAQLSSEKIAAKLLSRKILPVAGYNMYDGLQIGAIAHNIQLSPKDLIYYIAPAYGFNSQKITGLAGVTYKLRNIPIANAEYLELGTEIATFSINKGEDYLQKKIFTDVYKLVPKARVVFNSGKDRFAYAEVKSFFFQEKKFNYVLAETDSVFYPAQGEPEKRFLLEYNYRVENNRKLFPYNVHLQFQHSQSFYRLNTQLHYFFNYLNHGGVQLRLFAAKFGYFGTVTNEKRYAAERFQPKLTALTGYEDYTYSNYFIGRNEFDGFSSQQIMMRDGALKLRTDKFQDLQGRSDNWVASLNLSTTLPASVFPPKFPLKIFLDIGSYADLWKKDVPDSRFLYVAGLQLSIFKDVINIYAPVLYSKKFRTNISSVPEENKFFRKISFSIDIQKLNLRKLSTQTNS